MNYITIPSLPVEDRPREKMHRIGARNLSSSELLAILVNTGTPKNSALDLGRKLLLEFDGLEHLAQANLSDLTQINGIGLAKASVLAAAFELGRRKLRKGKASDRLCNPKKIADYLRPKLIDHTEEHFWVLYMNAACGLLGERMVAVGGQTEVMVDPRVVLREAVQFKATSLVLSHNHPSGDPTPSSHDHSLTIRMIKAGQIIGCKVLDHIIVSNRSYYSYSDTGKLDELRRDSYLKWLNE